MGSPLIIDASSHQGDPELGAILAAGAPWHGCILKATQGTYFTGGDWFRTHWPEARKLAGARYGVDWFRGCYHYLDVSIDGAKQADYFCDHVERAGGWGPGDLWPAVDVERAHNPGATREQVVACVKAFSARVKLRTGREVMLYAGSFWRDLGITEQCGCRHIWIKRYASTLPRSDYQALGWNEPTLWQYCGDSVGFLAGYPTESPAGPRKTDISVLTLAGGLPRLRAELGFINFQMLALLALLGALFLLGR